MTAGRARSEPGADRQPRPSIIHIAKPIQITRREQAVVDDVLLSPEFEGEVKQHVGMIAVNVVGHILDAFVDALERFGPGTVVMALGIAARRFTVSVKHGGEVDLDVTPGDSGQSIR